MSEFEEVRFNPRLESAMPPGQRILLTVLNRALQTEGLDTTIAGHFFVNQNLYSFPTGFKVRVVDQLYDHFQINDFPKSIMGEEEARENDVSGALFYERFGIPGGWVVKEHQLIDWEKVFRYLGGKHLNSAINSLRFGEFAEIAKATVVSNKLACTTRVTEDYAESFRDLTPQQWQQFIISLNPQPTGSNTEYAATLNEDQRTWEQQVNRAIKSVKSLKYFPAERLADVFAIFMDLSSTQELHKRTDLIDQLAHQTEKGKNAFLQLDLALIPKVPPLRC